jgi:hypothetical protein
MPATAPLRRSARGDPRQRLGLAVLPQAEVAVRVAPALLDGRGADEHDARPTHRKPGQMG